MVSERRFAIRIERNYRSADYTSGLFIVLLRAVPAVPSEWLISGLVYDVATGLVEIIVPPVPIRAAA